MYSISQIAKFRNLLDIDKYNYTFLLLDIDYYPSLP